MCTGVPGGTLVQTVHLFLVCFLLPPRPLQQLDPHKSSGIPPTADVDFVGVFQIIGFLVCFTVSKKFKLSLLHCYCTLFDSVLEYTNTCSKAVILQWLLSDTGNRPFERVWITPCLTSKSRPSISSPPWPPACWGTSGRWK